MKIIYRAPKRVINLNPLATRVREMGAMMKMIFLPLRGMTLPKYKES